MVPGPLEDKVGLLGVRVGAWNHFGYAVPQDGQAGIPPLGERGADAIKAGHGAVKVIDEIIRDLHVLRGQLVSELRADDDANATRVDAMLAEARASERRSSEPPRRRPRILAGSCERCGSTYARTAEPAPGAAPNLTRTGKTTRKKSRAQGAAPLAARATATTTRRTTYGRATRLLGRHRLDSQIRASGGIWGGRPPGIRYQPPPLTSAGERGHQSLTASAHIREP